ncbi:MAG: formyltransferase family protein [Minwuia sp.]|nr:formyltransferase family protein [Minwuia sp.]
MKRVIVLTTGGGGTAAICLPRLVLSEAIEVVAVVRARGMNPDASARRRKSKLRKVLRIGVLGALNGIRMRKWFRHRHESLESVCASAGVPLHDVPYIGSVETEQIVRQAKVDLGLSLGNSFIPKRIFSIPEYGMLNMHGERLPAYQNAQSIIWPVYNTEITTGVTVHRISSVIDEGDILYSVEFPIQFGPSLEETVRKTLMDTRTHVVEAILHCCENLDELLSTSKKQQGGDHYTTPTFWQYLRMERNNRRFYKLHAAKQR